MSRGGFTGGMTGSPLRRTGFAAVLVAGLALSGSAMHGIGGMDASLQLAAERTAPAPDERRVADRVWCPDEAPERS